MTQLQEASFLHHVRDGYHMLPHPGVVLHPGGDGLGGGAGVSLHILVSVAGHLVMIILVTSAWFNIRWIERSDPTLITCSLSLGFSLNILVSVAGRLVMIILVTSAWFIIRWIERSDPIIQGSVVEAEASLGTVALCVYSLYLYPAWCLTASHCPRSWSWSGQRPA